MVYIDSFNGLEFRIQCHSLVFMAGVDKSEGFFFEKESPYRV